MIRHGLTHREWEVAQLNYFGLIEKEMATFLGISVNTVRSYKKSMCDKTGCRTNLDMSRWYGEQVSKIKLEPPEAIRKFISTFMLVMVLLAEFSFVEAIRPLRTRLPKNAESEAPVRRPGRSVSNRIYKFEYA